MQWFRQSRLNVAAISAKIDRTLCRLPLERLDGFSGKVKDILEDAAQFDDGRAAKIATAIEGRIQTLRSMTM